MYIIQPIYPVMLLPVLERFKIDEDAPVDYGDECVIVHVT
jgi:hypothetical protein